jgi:hypothetical protein
MAKFKITYQPLWTEDELDRKSVIMNFEDTAGITAEEWAEDYAYSLADKGYHKVEKLN